MRLATGQSPFWPSLGQASRPESQANEAVADLLPKLLVPEGHGSGPGTASRGAMWRKKMPRQESFTSEGTYELVTPDNAEQDLQGIFLPSITDLQSPAEHEASIQVQDSKRGRPALAVIST